MEPILIVLEYLLEVVGPRFVDQMDITTELLRGSNRHCEVSAKRAKAVVKLVREQGRRVGEVAQFLRCDQASISMMLLRASAKERN